MGRNTFFQFKQFRVVQEKAAMKVGIDGVLLGAWANTTNCSKILDVGTGTGLIALMLAQRSVAKMTAIEIEENAAVEAGDNVLLSPWKDRIKVRHISFQDFAEKNTDTFDLIVSNPPYFSNASKAATTERSLARHNDKLPFNALIELSTKMLIANGRLSIIVPFDVMTAIVDTAKKNNLFLQRITTIKPKADKAANRVLLEWSKSETALHESCLVIYNEDNSFTPEYIDLTRDYYLRF